MVENGVMEGGFAEIKTTMVEFTVVNVLTKKLSNRKLAVLKGAAAWHDKDEEQRLNQGNML